MVGPHHVGRLADLLDSVEQKGSQVRSRAWGLSASAVISLSVRPPLVLKRAFFSLLSFVEKVCAVEEMPITEDLTTPRRGSSVSAWVNAAPQVVTLRYGAYDASTGVAVQSWASVTVALTDAPTAVVATNATTDGAGRPSAQLQVDIVATVKHGTLVVAPSQVRTYLALI